MLDVRLPDGATGDITVFGAHLAAASRDWGKEAGASAQRLFDSARPLCYAALSIVGLWVCYTVVVGMHREFFPRPPMHDEVHRSAEPRGP